MKTVDIPSRINILIPENIINAILLNVLEKITGPQEIFRSKTRAVKGHEKKWSAAGPHVVIACKNRDDVGKRFVRHDDRILRSVFPKP